MGAGRWRRGAERRGVGDGSEGRWVSVCEFVAELDGRFGLEKMLVPRAASEVCRMVTSAVNAFWGVVASLGQSLVAWSWSHWTHRAGLPQYFYEWPKA